MAPIPTSCCMHEPGGLDCRGSHLHLPVACMHEPGDPLNSLPCLLLLQCMQCCHMHAWHMSTVHDPFKGSEWIPVDG